MSFRRASYVILFGIAAAAAFGKTLLYARLLEPAQFGVVMLALLITTLGAYPAALGLLEGLAREVPMRRGANQETVLLRSETLTAVAIAAMFFGLILTLICVALGWGQPALTALSWAGILMVATVVFNGLLCDLQVREHSTEYAALLALKSLLAALFAFILNGRFDALGVLIGEIVALLSCAVLCLCLWSRDLQWRMASRSSLVSLAKIGIPFSVSNFLQNFSVNIDRWAVQLTLGVAALGTYTFAMHFTSIGSVLLNMVHLYAAPKVLRQYGSNGDGRMVVRSVIRLALMTIVIFAVGAIPFMLLFPALITGWYPQYMEATQLTTWVYVGTAAITVGFFDILFRALGDGRPLVRMQIGVAILAVLACALLSWADSSLAGYAAVFAGARVLAAALGWYFGVRNTRLVYAVV